MNEARRRKVVRLKEGELERAIEANHTPTLDPEQTQAWARELTRLRGSLDLGTLAAFTGHTTLVITSALEGRCQELGVYQDLKKALTPHREGPMDVIEKAWFDGERAKVGEWLRALALERYDNVTAAKRAIGEHFERSPQWVHTVFKGLPRGLESYAMVGASIMSEPPSWLVAPGSELADLNPLPVQTTSAPTPTPNVDFEAYGARLRDEVKRLGWTWTQTGAKLNRSRSYIGKLFLGRIEDLAPYEQLAAALRDHDASGAPDPTLTDDEAQDYAARLRARIAELDWTQRATAEFLDVPFNTFKKMLRGARTRRQPYEAVLASLADAIPAAPADDVPSLDTLYAPPAQSGELARLRARALEAWPSGDLTEVGGWLRATLDAGLLRGATRHRASKELAVRAGHSIFWVTSRLSGKVRSSDGYDTLADLLGVSLTPVAAPPTPVPPVMDEAREHQQTLVRMIEELTATVSALHQRVEQLEGRPAWADELVSQAAPAAPAPLVEDGFDELAIEAATSHPQGTLLYRTDGEVFLITHAGKAYVATETFGLPLDEDLPKWNPTRKKR